MKQRLQEFKDSMADSGTWFNRYYVLSLYDSHFTMYRRYNSKILLQSGSRWDVETKMEELCLSGLEIGEVYYASY